LKDDDGAQSAIYSTDTRGYFTGDKVAGTWSWPQTFL